MKIVSLERKKMKELKKKSGGRGENEIRDSARKTADNGEI